jgi:glycosyltransferase involved in cell wall biosynthesis
MSQSRLMAQDTHSASSHLPVSDGCVRRGPLVTVLLPTYNRRRSLPRALASLVRQTYRDLEIFVIRDGGEDVSDIVRSFSDPRLIFIDRSENRGKPHSLNEALTRATGKYVAYLDDDDIYYPGHVETLVTALENQTDCQVAYSDLYKTYCQELPDGDQVVLSKEVEISRDFDRYLMLYFNHVLHVSLMHRRDLLARTGLYNENLNILIDWDMTRRLVFFTDFYHVPAVTGEFYSPVGECDRISVQRRKDPKEYIRNLLSIRTTRPAKPWPRMEDLSIVVLADRVDQSVKDTLVRIWSHTFYPYRLYLALPAADLARFTTHMPNVTVVPMPDAAGAQERLDRVLRQVEGPYVAIVPAGTTIEEMWIENPLYTLIRHPVPSLGFLIDGAPVGTWAAVLRLTDLQQARQAHPQMSSAASLAACGVQVRSPAPEELPFQFDDWLRQAKLIEAEGDWQGAAQSYESMAERHRNELWMTSMAAQAYFRAGRYNIAQRLSRHVNGQRPTIDTLLLEAKTCRQTGDFHRAIQLLADAEQRLDDQVVGPFSTVKQPALHK